jgi:hypothetical protein
MPRGPRGGPHKCLGCHRPIIYGDRCRACATEARVKADKQRRRRKPR